MTIETVPGHGDLHYFLISHDKNGAERQDDPDGANGSLSQRLLDEAQRKPVTDIFLISHGWKGDVPAAKRQYDAWIAAMAKL